ncbi:unnamed protein product [Polarella glacialis]|uniref:Uncharacterized protein n=1 Tax=Polarella glacialis TaxID=89957 RepID=A0A813G700_POLGL|nr:unnamed protein product [Polarella glacialis]
MAQKLPIGRLLRAWCRRGKFKDYFRRESELRLQEATEPLAEINAELFTCATFFFQLETATATKQTRCILRLAGAALQPSPGWSFFDEKTRYDGRLPMACGYSRKQLLGNNYQEPFKTSATASYPPAMCMMLALIIVNAHWLPGEDAEGSFRLLPQDPSGERSTDLNCR